MVVAYPIVDVQSTDEKRHRRDLAKGVNSLRDGKVNSAVDISLETSGITTTVVNSKISATSRIILTPSNDNAASEFAAGTIRIDDGSIVHGQFTIQHTEFPLARTFRVSFLS